MTAKRTDRSEKSTFSLATAMEWLQDDLVRTLTKGRERLPHPVEVGDNAELQWIEMLQGFLPKRYTVAKAFVIDMHGAISEQMDVVIYDQQYTPQIFRRDGTVYIPAEAVYAVFEAKQDLTKAHIRYAAKKIASVRRLHRTSAKVPHAGGTFEAREPHDIIGGILTLDSGWKKDPLGEPLGKALAEWSDDAHRLDLGCVASRGAFSTARDATLDQVWDRPDRALVWFVTQLLDRLRPIATVPAMDIVQWAEAALNG